MVTRIAVFFMLALNGFGAAYTSTRSGLFTDSATWGGGGAPNLNGDTFAIADGHTVWYDTDNSAHAAGWGASTVNGVLAITNAAFLKMNGILTGTGAWTIGSESAPIGYTVDNLPAVIIAFTGSAYCNMSGTIAWYGATNHFCDYITNTVTITGDSTNLFFAANVSNLASNDVVYVDNHNVRGQGGSLHLVYNVETNRVTLRSTIPAELAVVTNQWPGSTIIGGLITNNRTNGTQVCKLTRPVVALQPVKISNVGLFHSSNNGVLRGARLANLGRGPVNGRVKWIIVGCVGNNNSSGGIASSGSGHVITSCVGNNNSSGGIAYSGSGHVITSCVGNNNSYSGIASSGSGHVITSCVGNNNSNGGIANSGAGHVITSCVGNNNSNGGIANSGAGHVITSCVGNNNSYGGIASAGSSVIINCSATNQPTPFLAYAPSSTTIFDTNGYTVTESITSAAYSRAPYDVLVWNRTNFFADAGSTILTNAATSFSPFVFAHYPSRTNDPVPMYIDISLKPASTRSIGVWVLGQANTSYKYAVTPQFGQPVNPVAINAPSGWTLISVPLTNDLPQASTMRLWVEYRCTNTITTGFSWVDVPTDSTIKYQ